MRACLALALVALAPVLLGAGIDRPEAKPDDTPAKAKQASARGADYLKSTQRDGNWEHLSSGLAVQYQGGTTCLALLGLLEAGVKPDDPAVTSGLEYVRGLPPSRTYVVALQTAVLAKANQPADQALLQRNADWLVDKASRANGMIRWGYPSVATYDNSNTQYAVLGLHYAAQAGIPIDKKVWEEIGAHYRQDRLATHGWSYKDGNPLGERATMVSAGITGLATVQQHLKEFDARKELEESWARLGQVYNVRSGRNPTNFRYYGMFAMRRAGELTGRSALKDANGNEIRWYRLGVDELLRTQQPDGCWQATDTHDGNPVLATSFALLFLADAEKLLKQ